MKFTALNCAVSRCQHHAPFSCPIRFVYLGWTIYATKKLQHASATLRTHENDVITHCYSNANPNLEKGTKCGL